MFKKYIHLEKFGTDEVQGIELGKCYIFPKIDGTNASIWCDNGEINAGSRKRHLTLEKDNAGFFEWVLQQEMFNRFFTVNDNLRLYGEWLVPHSLKTYREDAWRKFYVFDVEINGDFIRYTDYKPILESFGIDYIPPICAMRNGPYEAIIKEMENNNYLIQDGKGTGEGIVVKNYDYKNRFGRTCWAKIVTSSFKEKHTKEMGVTVKEGKQMVEQLIVNKYVDNHLVNKVYEKIKVEMDGWKSKYIPRLLQTVYYDLINEEIWQVVKEMKNPTINFRTLSSLTTMKIKEIRQDLF
jgi:hypothetical protein